MSLKRVLIRETDGTHLVEMKEVDGVRELPIMIGLAEASAIERALMEHEPIRPLTHELLSSILAATGWRLERVHIHTLEAQTFYATMFLVQDDAVREIDARPSDAIALACRAEAKVFVDSEVLDRTGE